jgi:hexulose-6-phosphate isomerase
LEVALQAGTFATLGKRFSEWIAVARDLDMKAMELWVDRDNLWPGTTTKKERKPYLEELRSEGMKVTSISPTPFKATAWQEFRFDYNLASPSESARTKAVAFYKSIIAIAVEFGAKNVLVVPGKIDESDLMKSKFSYRKHWEQLVKSLRECSKEAEDSDIYLGIENAVICNYIDLPEEISATVEAVNSDHVRAYLDIANANVFRDPEIYVRTLASMLCDTIHTTDNDGTYPYHLPIGMGNIDYTRIIRVLKEIGWDGYLLPELFYKEDPVGGLRRSKRALESIIKSTRR